MKDFLGKFQGEAHALLRIMAGAMFLFHGVQKVFGILSPHGMPPVGSQMWVGGILELTLGILIALGLRTRWAAFIASGEMAVAYFQFHWRFQFDANFIPGVNGGELAVLYCFVYLFLAAAGPGKWALDRDR